METPDHNSRKISRRVALGAGLGVGSLGLAAGLSQTTHGASLLRRVSAVFIDTNPSGPIPQVPTGAFGLEQRSSAIFGRDLEYYWAVPPQISRDSPEWAALPVVFILHGASARPHDYERFGFAQFLSATVASGAAPMALIGIEGPEDGWRSADAQQLIGDELPTWAEDSGFDASRIALWGWSRGGAGVLAYGQQPWGFKPRAIAAFSPAISSNDDLIVNPGGLTAQPTALWCGTEDPLITAAQSLSTKLQKMNSAPEIAQWSPGGHTRSLWNTFTIDALSFLSAHLHSA